MALNQALSLDEAGNYKHSVILWSDIKKSIKSTLAAAVILWRSFQVEWGQFFVIANDLKQADSRVFYYIRRSIELNPYLREQVKIISHRIELPNKTYIEAIPIDPTGEAGSNADCVCFSELWGAHQKAQQRMWSELTLSPMKFGQSFRWIETYAGFTGESPLLEQLYETGVKNGRRVEWANQFDPPIEAFENDAARMFTLWNGTPRLSWQRPSYYASEEAVLLPSEFKRMHRNEWASSEQSFVQMEWLKHCEEAPPALRKNQNVIIAMDAAISGDCFGLLMVSARDGDELDVRYARKWIPPKGGKLDFRKGNAQEGDPDDGPEAELRRLLEEYNVVEVAYDPYQLEDLAMRMSGELLAVFYAFNQGGERAVADKSLYDRIRSRRIHYWNMPDFEEHVLNANVKTEGEKMRLIKKSEQMKIDLAVCASMAADRATYWGI